MNLEEKYYVYFVNHLDHLVVESCTQMVTLKPLLLSQLNMLPKIAIHHFKISQIFILYLSVQLFQDDLENSFVCEI